MVMAKKKQKSRLVLLVPSLFSLFFSFFEVAISQPSSCDSPGGCVAGEQDGLLLQLQQTTSTTTESTSTTSKVGETTGTTTTVFVLGSFQEALPPDPCADFNIATNKTKCSTIDWLLDGDKFGNGKCDCPSCEDEVAFASLFNCTVCECPTPNATECNQRIRFCPNALPADVSQLESPCEDAWVNNPSWSDIKNGIDTLRPCASAAGWSVPSKKFGNGNCDCPQCEDENTTVKEECGGKYPTICGSFIPCREKHLVTEQLSEECRVGVQSQPNNFEPYFICGNWTIPYLYLNDFYCDCENCEDEPSFSCADCGCPDQCGFFTNCFSSILRQRFQNDECYRAFERIDFLGLSASFARNFNLPVYHCSRGDWQIPAEYVNDSYCDCLDCDDELDNPDIQGDCQTCGGCPANCGDSFPCYKVASGAVAEPAMPPNNNTCHNVWTADDFRYQPTDPGFDENDPNRTASFTCSSGWVIPASYVNDNFCDCPDCYDEQVGPNPTFWTCFTCGSCPLSCGAVSECGDHPACFIDKDATPFYCGTVEGFFIDSLYINDGFCDCPSCEDEEQYTCDQCGGCPVICQDYVPCFLGYSLELRSELSMEDYKEPSGSYQDCKLAAFINDWWDSDIHLDFICSVDWLLPTTYRNDGYCDCPGCEDEDDDSNDCTICQIAGVCPFFCGESIPCKNITEQNGKHKHCDSALLSNEWDAAFQCYSGWWVSGDAVDDNACDCTECEDEPNTGWTCDTCGACPTKCGESANCAETFGECEPPVEEWPCPQTPEFKIEISKRENRECDCPYCEDESVTGFDCATCGGCPVLCGDVIDCNFGLSPFYTTFKDITLIRPITSSTLPTASSSETASTSAPSSSSSTSVSSSTSSPSGPSGISGPSSTSASPASSGTSGSSSTSASSTTSSPSGPSGTVSTSRPSSTSASPASSGTSGTSSTSGSSTTSSPSGPSGTVSTSGPSSTSASPASSGTSGSSSTSGSASTSSPLGTLSTSSTSARRLGASTTSSPGTSPALPGLTPEQRRQQRREQRRERRRRRQNRFLQQNPTGTSPPRSRLSRISMLEEEKSKARLDGHVGRVGRGFYKTKPNSTFGSHWDPEKVHHVPGYRNPVVYQAKMKERQAALKLQGTAHTPNIHTSEMGALKRESPDSAEEEKPESEGE